MRWRWLAACVAGALLGALRPGVAAADEPWLRLTGFFGARTFASDSALGTPTRSSLANSVIFGLRGAHRVRDWLSFEGELPLVITGSRDDEASVLFLEPRVHALFERRLRPNLRAFVVAGAGMPTTLSSNRPRYASDVQPEWHLGGGIKLDRTKGISLRLDARLVLVPARGDGLLAPEVEVTLSLYRFSAAPRSAAEKVPENLDHDADGVPDDRDQCPDRAEDRDGFEDDDGCPDIDDDRDEVLDIADKCRLEPETWNGYADDDGCPDALPTDVAQLEGVLEGVRFRPGSAVMTRRARRVLDHVAAVLVRYPSVRARIIGHADNQGSTETNIDLSQRRAEAVKYYLVAKGVTETRLGAVGVGADAPLVQGTDAASRAKNRRIEFQIRRRDQ